MALPTYSDGTTFAGKTSTARVSEHKSLTAVNYINTADASVDNATIIAAPASGKTLNVWAIHVSYTSNAVGAGVGYALQEQRIFTLAL